MTKTARSIIVVLVALIAITAIAVYWLVSNLDSIVAGAIEKAGSQATGVPVAVSGVSISLKEGRGEIRGLTVGNPAGFDGPYALKLGSIALAIDTESIGSDPVRIKQISVDGARLLAEIKVGAGINLAKISDNLGSGGKDTSPAGSGGQGPRIVIERFDFTNASMTLKAPAREDRTQNLGDIHVTNIGEGSGGATAAQAASQLLGPVIREAAKQARSGAAEMGVEGYKQGAIDKLKDKLGIGN